MYRKPPPDPPKKKKHGHPDTHKNKANKHKHHRRSKQGKQRGDRPYRYGLADRFPDLNSTPKFRFGLLRASGQIVQLRHVEACNWDDTTAILTGSITFRKAVFSGDPTPTPTQGDRVICVCDEGGGFRELWTMRVYKPQLAVEDRQYTYDLASDLDLLRQSEGFFSYGKDKKHPHGWRPDQIIVDICKQFHVQVGRIYQSTKRRQHYRTSNKVSPLHAIQKQLKYEYRHNGPRLVVRYEGGKLWVLPLRRSPHLLKLGPTLTQAAFTSELPPEYGSAVMVRGLPELMNEATGNTNVRKTWVKVESDVSRKRFGYVQRVVFSPDARSLATLRKEGKAYLRAIAKPKKTLTLTHPGIPHIRRGDAIRLALGDQGLRRQVVWVTEASHMLTPEGYTMQLTVVFDDPYRDHHGEKIIWKLKGTHDEAVGNRATRYGPTWWARNQKDDTVKESRAGSIFSDAWNRLFGGG